MVGTKSWKSLLNRPGGEGIEETLFQVVKKHFQEEYLSQKVVLAVFPSQSEESRWFFLFSSDFWFPPCSNP